MYSPISGVPSFGMVSALTAGKNVIMVRRRTRMNTVAERRSMVKNYFGIL
jgi:hypothetical protein